MSFLYWENILPVGLISDLPMSDLSVLEKLKIERALGMGSGYVLNFSNRTFADFFLDTVNINIYDEKYNYSSGSKANRMRAFWEQESNHVVGSLLDVLFTEWNELNNDNSPSTPPDECLRIVRRLKDSAPVPDISAINPNAEEQTFEALARSVRESINRNEPEAGLDRLHTFLVKYFRILCNKRGVDSSRNKPLHSLVGEYVKAIKKEGLIESGMTERILKSSISVMEAFNHVRNEQSFAHDSKLLNYDESILIFSHVCSLVKFIEAMENNDIILPYSEHNEFDDLPF